MPTKLLTLGRRLWRTGNTRLDRRNLRAWVQALRSLGPRWLLAQHVERRQ